MLTRRRTPKNSWVRSPRKCFVSWPRNSYQISATNGSHICLHRRCERCHQKIYCDQKLSKSIPQARILVCNPTHETAICGKIMHLSWLLVLTWVCQYTKRISCQYKSKTDANGRRLQPLDIWHGTSKQGCEYFQVSVFDHDISRNCVQLYYGSVKHFVQTPVKNRLKSGNELKGSDTKLSNSKEEIAYFFVEAACDQNKDFRLKECCTWSLQNILSEFLAFFVP